MAAIVRFLRLAGVWRESGSIYTPPSSGGGDFLTTEDGDFLVTEAGDFLIT